MAYTPGTIVEGTVKTITGFGAFVLLPDGQTGLVHISEVAPTFVTDIRRHLTEGQTVKVKVLSQGEGGKISLSARSRPPRRRRNRAAASGTPCRRRPSRAQTRRAREL